VDDDGGRQREARHAAADGRRVAARSWRATARRGREADARGAHLRRSLRALTTRRLDGRSALAVAVRNWKEDVRRDLGGDLTRAQVTILEATAQAWVIVSSLDDWIARQSSLVTKQRTVLPIVVQWMQIPEGLARNLEQLGLERKAKPVPDVTTLPDSAGEAGGRGLVTAIRRALRLH